MLGGLANIPNRSTNNGQRDLQQMHSTLSMSLPIQTCRGPPVDPLRHQNSADHSHL